ncbi:MAG TPA: hypothetical protein VMJ75_07015 [Candidatus Acidoferrales bacterium]|nr:hypothetical protein [Candidatus Acidoferrales bacterium]
MRAEWAKCTRARDTRLDRAVAIKIASQGFNERFGRGSTGHPHICQLYDVGPNYLVMGLVDGQPLKGPLPPAVAVAHANQILDALATSPASIRPSRRPPSQTITHPIFPPRGFNARN